MNYSDIVCVSMCIYHLPGTTKYLLKMTNYHKTTLTPITCEEAYYNSNTFGVAIHHIVPKELDEGLQTQIIFKE